MLFPLYIYCWLHKQKCKLMLGFFHDPGGTLEVPGGKGALFTLISQAFYVSLSLSRLPTSPPLQQLSRSRRRFFPKPGRLGVDRYPHNGLQHPRWRNARGLDKFIKGVPNFSVDANSHASPRFAIFHLLRFPPQYIKRIPLLWHFVKTFCISIRKNFSPIWTKERD